MFEVKLDGVDDLLAKVSKFAAQITELHTSMPQQLEEWQREDMKRKYPNMEVDSVGNQVSATTFIWPRSRSDIKRRRYQGPKQYRIKQAGPVVRSNRPILRAELQEKLFDRMRKLVAEAAKWP